MVDSQDRSGGFVNEDESEAEPVSDSPQQLPHSTATKQTIVRHMPYFLIVAQEEHFHKAAGILNVTQSALSRRIQMLEYELGGKLFNRGQRGVTLTDMGRAFFKDVLVIMEDLDRSISRARAMVRGDEGRLRIALNETAMRSPRVSSALREFRESEKRVGLEIAALLSEAQVQGLNNQTLDGGFLFELPNIDLPEATFERLAIMEEAMVLALPAAHPLATKEDLCVADLASEPLSWPSRESGRHLFDWMISEFRAANVSPIIGLEVLSADTTVNLAASGLGMGFIGDHQYAPPSVVLRKLPDFNVKLQLNFVWRRSDKSKSLRSLIRWLEAGR